MVNDKKSINDYLKGALENVSMTEQDIINLKDNLITSLKRKNS
jgi:hypothetical protein